MLAAQKKVVDYGTALLQKAKTANLGDDVAQKAEVIIAETQNRKLVVPIVGGFSSGKSSLINKLLGNNVLPVAITPETSLAAELYYVPEKSAEKIEAVKLDGGIDTYRIDAIKEMTDKAGNYIYARVFLNNKGLQEIEPLVLVDMPGFDSPLDAHDKAIMAYLERGCHYIVLSSVDEGTVSSSLLRRLQEIDSFGRGFSFFLSKTDLRSSDTVNELLRHYQKQIEDHFDTQSPVVPLSNESGAEVMRCLKGIDANKIFLSLYRDRILDICEEIITTINLKISSSKKDTDSIRSAIKEMDNSIAQLKSKAESEADDMWRRYSGGMINDIVSDVGKALDSSVDELVSVAKSGNQEAVSERLNEVVRSALVITIKDKLGAVSQQITSDFSTSLVGLDKIMKDLAIDDNYIQGLSARIQSAATIAQEALLVQTAPAAGAALAGTVGKAGGAAATLFGGSAVTGIATVIGGAAAAAVIGPIAAVAMPIIGILLLFCPDILSGIFKGSKENKQQEAIKSKLIGEVFPAIKRKIRAEIPQHLEEQVKRMIDGVRAQYEAKIKEQSEVINAQIAEKTATASEVEAKRVELESVRADVQSMMNDILGWEK